MNRPIHITVAAAYFYPKIGGLENYAYLLAKKLQENGTYKISVVTSNYNNKGYKKESIDGMTVHRLPISFKVSNTPINLRWYGTIKKILIDEQTDIVHVHSPVPFLPDIAAWAAKERPVVLTYHSGSMRKNAWLADIAISFYESIFLKKLFERADAIVAISQEFARRKFPYLAYKTYFIPTGVDLDRFRKTDIPKDSEVVTFVGRIEHSSSWKGIEQLLQAMTLVLRERPNAKLELAGGGDALEHYRERALELQIGSAVKFLGPQLGNDLVETYRRSNVVVLPSTSDSEAFSVALVEAMASGRPLVGTNIGGTPQVITEHKNGLLVPPKNPEKLAEAITKILSDPTLAQALGNHGHSMAQHFSWDVQAKKYSDIFETIFHHK